VEKIVHSIQIECMQSLLLVGRNRAKGLVMTPPKNFIQYSDELLFDGVYYDIRSGHTADKLMAD